MKLLEAEVKNGLESYFRSRPEEMDDIEGTFLGRPFFIMERIIGHNLHDALYNAEGEAYDRLMESWIKLFVKLHKLDCSEFIENGLFLKELFPYTSEFDREHPYSCIDNYINALRFLSDTFHAGEGFTQPFEWLEQYKITVPCFKPSVTHQDFNDNNILVDMSGKLYVIDWSGMDISDFRVDLASAIQVWTKYQDPVMRQRILNTYEEAARIKIENIEYFEAGICLKKLLLASIQSNNDINKHGVRSAADIRQELLHYQTTYNYWLKITGVKIPFMEELN